MKNRKRPVTALNYSPALWSVCPTTFTPEAAVGRVTHWLVVDPSFDRKDLTGRSIAECSNKQDAKEIAAALNAAPKLARALRRMIGAHSALMPGLKDIAVDDYALQNDGPIEAKLALLAYEKERK